MCEVVFIFLGIDERTAIDVKEEKPSLSSLSVVQMLQLALLVDLKKTFFGQLQVLSAAFSLPTVLVGTFLAQWSRVLIIPSLCSRGW